ncbi:peptidyl-prolyl cis-trans isomerase ppi1-like [Octopus sinensis]|uniref:Peptidyl-prolyl cis-trans isomerase n=1 Tax=Octopus sinensis TaxID=2607531 RepID=A0A6P7U0G6_9MOLL|nr:peptidyl-prolyl cis-trans isomerase ppi1-like [Octopus sinensis]
MLHLKPGISTKSLKSSLGKITFELYWDYAKNTCRNFAQLSKIGYYNGVTFHRVVNNFIIQGGDPTGTGRGGQSIYGKNFDDEITGSLKHTGAGILSMANSGKDSNGSQFFITLCPCQQLDMKHTIFGRVDSGMSVIRRIGMVDTDHNDKPIDPIIIHKAYEF